MTNVFDTIREGDLDQVRELVDEHPEVLDERNDEGNSPPVWAFYVGKPDLAEYLRGRLTRELDVWEAAIFGDLETVKKYVSEHPDEVDPMGKDGFTPLLLAAYFGHPEIVRYLLEAGADPTVSSRNGLHVAPIHAASSENHGEIVDMLLERRVPVNVTTGEGYTPLHNAAQNGNAKMIKQLLEAGADPAQPMYEGKVAIDFAREHGDPEGVEAIEAALATR